MTELAGSLSGVTTGTDALRVASLSRPVIVMRGYPPRDQFPSVRVGATPLTPQPATPPAADATTVERLSALLRPMHPRANGYFATVARHAYESAMLD